MAIELRARAKHTLLALSLAYFFKERDFARARERARFLCTLPNSANNTSVYAASTRVPYLIRVVSRYITLFLLLESCIIDTSFSLYGVRVSIIFFVSLSPPYSQN